MCVLTSTHLSENASNSDDDEDDNTILGPCPIPFVVMGVLANVFYMKSKKTDAGLEMTKKQEVDA